MNLTWVASRLRATSFAFSAFGPREAGRPGGIADVPDDRPGNVGEVPASDPRPHVEVDVLVEGEVALVVAAELVEQLAPQQAGGATDAEDLPRAQVLGPLDSPAASSTARPSRVRAWPVL